jgi:hypothetical protein
MRQPGVRLTPVILATQEDRGSKPTYLSISKNPLQIKRTGGVAQGVQTPVPKKKEPACSGPHLWFEIYKHTHINIWKGLQFIIQLEGKRPVKTQLEKENRSGATVGLLF